MAKEQSKLQLRLDELVQITKKLYVDNALSKISDDEYAKLSAEFIDERRQAEERLTAITEELKEEERNHENVARFTAIIEKYFGIKELNKTVPNKKIGQIEVHAAEKIYGELVQKVDVYYRFIGNLN